MSTDLQAQPAPYKLVPTSFEDAVRISGTLAKSELVPKDFRGKPENVFVAIQWGQEIGLPALQALQNIAVINGRPSIWGDAALALVTAHKDFEDIIEVLEGSGDGMVARCTVKRKNRSPVVREFAVTDAKRAGLWSKEGPWKNYPQRMLQLRARAFALRDSFPDAIKGISIAEEVQDEIEINPAPVRAPVAQPRAASEKPVTEYVDTSTGEVVEAASNDVEKPEVSVRQTHAPIEGVPTLSEGQIKVVRKRITDNKLDEAALAYAFGVDRIEAIPASEVNKALDWCKKAAQQ